MIYDKVFEQLHNASFTLGQTGVSRQVTAVSQATQEALSDDE